MNDTALAIPLALAAGLGEYGRHGMVITPEFGAGLRFGKIFADRPLHHDGPVHFGVKEFCESCNRCAEACPARARDRSPDIDAQSASRVSMRSDSPSTPRLPPRTSKVPSSLRNAHAGWLLTP